MSDLRAIYDALFEHYGPQHWWPGETPFEVIVGAVLVQNTAWRNVAATIRTLRDEDLLAPTSLYELPVETLEEKIRSVGYYRIKAKRLRNVLAFLLDEFDGDLDRMFATEPTELRERLLGVNGVGPETADSILLYAGEIPTFVVDAYTIRVLTRHGLLDFDADYHRTKELFEDQLPCEAPLFNEFHALFVRVGKEQCAKRSPKCEGCPLEGLLPEGGAISPDF